MRKIKKAISIIAAVAMIMSQGSMPVSAADLTEDTIFNDIEVDKVLIDEDEAAVSADAVKPGELVFCDNSAEEELENEPVGTAPKDSFDTIECVGTSQGVSGMGTVTDPFVVDTWSDLCETLQMDECYVKLGADVKYGEGDGDYASDNLKILNEKTVTLDLNGHVIDRGLSSLTMNDGYAIKVDAGATLNLIDSAKDATHTPMIQYTDPVEGSDVTVNGGIITGGANLDGNVIVDGTLNMYGGSVHSAIHNMGSTSGIYLAGTLNMYGGSVCGNSRNGINTSSSGASIVINMYGGSICGNRGRGLAISNCSQFNMYNGSICNNFPGDNYVGGGVAFVGNAPFKMYGGIIKNNKAASGAGVTVSGTQPFIMYGGIIEENTASGDHGGGGVLIGDITSSFVMYGGIVRNNSGPLGRENISCNKNSNSNAEFLWNSGTIALASKCSIDSNVSLADLGVQFIDGTDMSNPIPTSYISSASSEVLTAGSYQLIEDKVLSSSITITSGDVYLDLNGHKLTGPDGSETISVTGGTLHISDSVPEASHDPAVSFTDPIDGHSVTVNGGVITHNNNEGRGIKIEGGAVKMYSGSVCGNSVYSDSFTNAGGGVWIFQNGEFEMYGGSICGNSVGLAGGGVYAQQLTGNGFSFTMQGNSRIYGNKADSGGGGVAANGRSVNESTFKMKAGSLIDGNVAGSDNANNPYLGGGVDVGTLKFIMESGSAIRNNVVRSGNKAKGGGLSMSGADVTITGGVISGNKAIATAEGVITWGGGVYVAMGSSNVFKVSGSTQIIGNVATENGSTFDSNVFLKYDDNEHKKINIADNLSPAAKIGVTLEEPPTSHSDAGKVFTEGLSGKGNDKNFLSDQSGYYAYLSGNEAAIKKLISFTAQPVDLTFQEGAATGNVLSAATEIPTDGYTTYQWYSCDDINKANERTFGSPEDRADGTSVCTVSSASAGTFYYFCRASIHPDSYTTVSVDSAVATVTVTSKPGPVHNHSFTSRVTTEPACTAPGVMTYTCGGCGYSYTASIPALGHAYDAGVITKPATIVSDGLKTFTCSRCGTTKTEVIPKLDPATEEEKDIAEQIEALIEDLKDDTGELKVEVDVKTEKKDDGTTETVITVGGEEVVKIITDEDGEEKIESNIWSIGGDGVYTYTGLAIKPDVQVYDGLKELSAGSDYSVSYKNNTNAGTKAEAKVSFKGGYKGTPAIKANFTINPADLSKDATAMGIIIAANSKAQKPIPEITLTSSGKSLGKGDLKYRYLDSKGEVVSGIKEVGDYTVEAKGKKDNGNFTDTATATITVTGDKSKLLSNGKVKLTKKSYTYTGKPIIPEYTLTLDDTELKKGTDYTLVVKNNVNPGRATMIFTAANENKGGYVGKIIATFKIEKGKELKAAGEGSDFTYIYEENVPFSKGGAKPELIVKDEDTVLTPGKDYAVSYSNNTKVTDGKDAVITVKGKGIYKEKVTLNYAIVGKDIATLSGNIVVSDKAVSKKGYKDPTVTITDLDGKKLAKDKDYALSNDYTEPDENGVVTVNLIGKGNYSGSVPVSYRYLNKNAMIDNVKASKIPDKVYTGSRIRLTKKELAKLLYTGKAKSPTYLVEGKDFEVVGYSNNLKTGTAKVTLRGIGDRGGTKTVSFKIVASKKSIINVIVGSIKK